MYVLTEEQFMKRIKETAEDIINGGENLEDVAYDVADCLLYDYSDIQTYMDKNYPNENRAWKKWFIAESLNL